MKFSVQSSTFKILRITFAILSSKAFLLWLMGCWIVFYVTIAIWTNETFGQFVVILRENLLIQFPFVLFLAGGYLNIIRASREKIREGKVSFFARLILPLGIMVFLTGFFISITTRQFDWLIVGQEHIVKPRWSAESYKIAGIDSGLKESLLDIDINSGKGFFAYEPRVTVLDRASRSFEVGAFPPKKINGTYFHILKFGLAPGVRLFEGGNVKDEGYMPLRILAPGSSDYFEIQPYPYRFLVSMEPEKIIQKGNLKASQFNLKQPLFRVRIFKGEKVITEKDSRGEIRFDNLTLSFFEPTVWVQLEIVRDHGVPFILSGIVLILIGIPLSFAGLVLKFLRGISHGNPDML